MLYAGLAIGIAICAIQAVRTKNLLTSTLWLACASACLSGLLYLMGAREIAVIELSVGAGLVTVLLIFVLNLVDEEPLESQPALPRYLAGGLILLPLLLLAYLIFPAPNAVEAGPEVSFSVVVWQQRAVDVLLQLVLIFACVLGIWSLLSEKQQTAAHALDADQPQPEPIEPPIPPEAHSPEEIDHEHAVVV